MLNQFSTNGAVMNIAGSKEVSKKIIAISIADPASLPDLWDKKIFTRHTCGAEFKEIAVT